jgi:4-coumarate--CoA ligase
LAVVPPLLSFLASHPQVKAEQLTSVKSIYVGAAPVGKAMVEQCRKRMPDVTFREGEQMDQL